MEVWNSLLEELQPLAADCELEGGKAGNVAAWVRQAGDEALSDRVAYNDKHNRYGAGLVPNGRQRQRAVGDDRVRLLTDELYGIGLGSGCVSISPSIFEADVAAVEPAKLAKSLPKQAKASLRFGVVLTTRHQYADAPHPLGLRVRSDRPSRRGTTEEMNELAPCRLIELRRTLTRRVGFAAYRFREDRSASID